MNKEEINIIKERVGVKTTFYSRFVKRILDLLIAFIAIVVLSPLMLIVALLVLIKNGRPILYKQARPGRNGKVFNLYKFRSMTNAKDKDGNLLSDEKRITRFGKFIRKTSIDELPQLFNILKGDMSIIGPRPKLVKDVIFYRKDVIDTYLLALPGLTGYTQVHGRTHNSWENIFALDREYIKKITFWGDIKIFFGTFVALFKHKGETRTSETIKEEIQEYYYPDQMLKTGVVSQEQYNYGQQLAKDIINNKLLISYQPILQGEFKGKDIPTEVQASRENK